MPRRRVEIFSQGVDDALQGLTSSPYSGVGGGSESPWTGLRIPSVLTADTSVIAHAAAPRYLFCLATRVITRPCRLIGIRQLLTLGVDTAQGASPSRIVELAVTTPTFKFPDGNVSWHLVTENNSRPQNSKPTTDTNNWAFLWADGPAMLYQTFTNAAVDPITGAPILYMRGLTAYTPPIIATTSWKPIANLGTFYDVRFPWNDTPVWNNVDVYFGGGERVSFYASVLQSNPTTRKDIEFPTLTFGAIVNPPEEVFIQNFTFPSEGAVFAPIYWRIAGSLIFEDEE